METYKVPVAMYITAETLDDVNDFVQLFLEELEEDAKHYEVYPEGGPKAYFSHAEWKAI